jgi:hypothetical protein
MYCVLLLLQGTSVLVALRHHPNLHRPFLLCALPGNGDLALKQVCVCVWVCVYFRGRGESGFPISFVKIRYLERGV